MDIHLYDGDLPDGLDLGPEIAIDTEATGLRFDRDRLCLVQLSAGDGTCHLVQVGQDQTSAPNLEALLRDPARLKIFHFARFDVAMLKKQFGVTCAPVYCTKIASKLVRTYTDRHSLKELSRELLGLDVNKQEQSSDWASKHLSDSQKSYAAGDVLHLHEIKAVLDLMLVREGRDGLARACFEFLGVRAELDLAGWNDHDIFSHR